MINIAVKIKKITIYKKINEIIEDINLSSILFLSYLITKYSSWINYFF